MYLIHLRVVLMMMAAVHGVQRVVLVVMLVMVEAALRAERLRVQCRGGVGVGDGGRGRRQKDEWAVAHVRRFGASNVSATVAAGVSQVAAGALGENWKLERGGRSAVMGEKRKIMV